jgi:hypothetical protein
VWGLGFRVWGLGFYFTKAFVLSNDNPCLQQVWGSGFMGEDLGFEFWGLGSGVWGLGFGVWGLGVQAPCETRALFKDVRSSGR